METVYVVYSDSPHGDTIVSVHKTIEGANERVDELEAQHGYLSFYISMEEVEE